MSKFVFGGLLSGVGKGMSTEIKRKHESAQRDADVLRQQNLARFRADLVEEGRAGEREYQDTVRAGEREYKEGLLEESRGYQEGQEEVKQQRGMDKLEKEYELKGKLEDKRLGAKLAAEGATVGKFDNPKYKAASAAVNERYLADAFKQIDPESLEGFMVRDSVTGEVSYDMSKIRAQYPEMAKKRDTLMLLVEEELDKTNKPERAYQSAVNRLEQMTEKQLTDTVDDFEKGLADKYSSYGIDKDDVTKAAEVLPTDKEFAGIAALKGKNPEQYRAYVNLFAERGNVAMVDALKEAAGDKLSIPAASRKRQSWEDLEDYEAGLLTQGG